MNLFTIIERSHWIGWFDASSVEYAAFVNDAQKGFEGENQHHIRIVGDWKPPSVSLAPTPPNPRSTSIAEQSQTNRIESIMEM